MKRNNLQKERNVALRVFDNAEMIDASKKGLTVAHLSVSEGKAQQMLHHGLCTFG